MIRKQDILDRATEWRLRPDVVEKDYVLGWLLAGIALSELRTHWIFKGGTCIKKCFFETYRFSEDLDFSFRPDATYSQDGIREALHVVVRRTEELSGILFPLEFVEVRPRRNQQNQPTFEGRIAYRGPLAVPSYPRVLLDITQHEPVLTPPESRPIFHPYPDEIPPGLTVLTYSSDELLAEKTRALYERARPRDLYDITYLLENRPEAFHLPRTRDLFRSKCERKGLAVPSREELLRTIGAAAELRSEWINMLGHQLPALPSLEELLGRLPSLLRWIDEPAAVLPELTRPAPPVPAAEELVATAGIRYWGAGLPLEAIRFAGANRLLIEFSYNGRARIAEPYSLRRARTTGNLLLYAWEVGATHIKAFKVGQMRDVRVAGDSFVPRYRVEF